jgi:threonine dehydratase
MPIITPKQKVTQTKMFGEEFIEVNLIGDTYEECAMSAQKYTEENGMTLIPPFDNFKIIEGQGTVGVEILEELSKVDYLFIPVGGGGLAAGVGSYFKTFSPQTIVIGAEPEGAPSMYYALKARHPITLDNIEYFVDGASVNRVGDITFSICKDVLNDMHLVPEGKVCTTILKLYNEDAIVAEPAGALSIAALDDFSSEIKGKNVVCILSGGNNGHEHHTFAVKFFTGICKALCMIACTCTNNSTLQLRSRQSAHHIIGPADFIRTDGLQVFSF